MNPNFPYGQQQPIFQPIQFAPNYAALTNPPRVPTVFCPPELTGHIKIITGLVIQTLEEEVNENPFMQNLYLMVTNNGQSYYTGAFDEIVQKAICLIFDQQQSSGTQLDQAGKKKVVVWLLRSIASHEVTKSAHLQALCNQNPKWAEQVDVCNKQWQETRARIARCETYMRQMGIRPTPGYEGSSYAAAPAYGAAPPPAPPGYGQPPMQYDAYGNPIYPQQSPPAYGNPAYPTGGYPPQGGYPPAPPPPSPYPQHQYPNQGHPYPQPYPHYPQRPQAQPVPQMNGGFAGNGQARPGATADIDPNDMGLGSYRDDVEDVNPSSDS